MTPNMDIKPYEDSRFGKVTFVNTRKQSIWRPVEITGDGLQVTLSLATRNFDEQQVHDLICDSLARMRSDWERADRVKIDENFAINYHLLKIRVRPHDGEGYSYVLEDGIWYACYPNGSDFADDYVHARMAFLLDQIFEAAGDHYLETRGREIGNIIGTSIAEMKSGQLNPGVLGRNLQHIAEMDGKDKWENYRIEISRNLIVYPAEYLDSTIIHEYIHNFIWDHDDDFYSSCEYYCEKILGKGYNELKEKYSGRLVSVFSEKPFFRYKHSLPGPSVIWVNGKRLRRVGKDIVTREYYY